MAEEAGTYPEIDTEPAPVLSALASPHAHEFVRYFMASAIALAVDAGSLVLFTSVFSVPYLISGVISFVLGLITIYLLSIGWVFEQRRVRNPAHEFLLFACIGIVGLLLNEVILWVGTGLVGLHYMLSKVVSVGVVFTWNFGVRKYWLFR